jgi:hypothetical protein
MISDSDRQLIERVNTGLQDGETWQQIADALDMPLSTLYLRIKALGYRVSKRLVPIHAPALDQEHAA